MFPNEIHVLWGRILEGERETRILHSTRTNNKKLYRVAAAVVAAAKSLQSCPTLCDPIDSSPPGSPIPGILQARTLEWVAISFSNAGKWKVRVKLLSHVQLLATPWTAAPPSMGFSRQEYWSGVPLPSPYTVDYVSNQVLHWGRMDICVCMVQSLCCPPKTITTLLIGHSPI